MTTITRNAFYCQTHKNTVTTDDGECYCCFQERLHKAEKEAHAADLLNNLPDYVYTTWGWEQTNVTFIKVTRRTNKCLFGVEVKGYCLGEDGFMTGLSIPTEEIKGEEIKINLNKFDRYTEPVRISWYG